jgi:hypothetical protein
MLLKVLGKNVYIQNSIDPKHNVIVLPHSIHGYNIFESDTVPISHLSHTKWKEALSEQRGLDDTMHVLKFFVKNDLVESSLYIFGEP